jgi:2'-5' RNA ligase
MGVDLLCYTGGMTISPGTQVKYLLVARLSGQEWPAMSDYRRRYFPAGHSRAPLHLTLVPPFFYPGHFPDLQALVHSVIEQEQLTGFSLTVTGVDRGFPQPRLVVLRIAPNQRLTRVYQAFRQALTPVVHHVTPDRSRFTFRPHLTVVKVKPGDQQAWQQHAQSLDQQFSCSTLRLEGVELWEEISEQWHSKATLYLH